jgi:hypothetical protein
VHSRHSAFWDEEAEEKKKKNEEANKKVYCYYYYCNRHCISSSILLTYKAPDTLENPGSSIVTRQISSEFYWEKHEITMERRLPGGLLMCRGFIYISRFYFISIRSQIVVS